MPNKDISEPLEVFNLALYRIPNPDHFLLVAKLKGKLNKTGGPWAKSICLLINPDLDITSLCYEMLESSFSALLKQYKLDFLK